MSQPVKRNSLAEQPSAARTAESVAGVGPLVIVGRYHYWTVGRVASAHSNVECSAVALLLGSTLAYGLRREVKNLALSAENARASAELMVTPRRVHSHGLIRFLRCRW